MISRNGGIDPGTGGGGEVRSQKSEDGSQRAEGGGRGRPNVGGGRRPRATIRGFVGFVPRYARVTEYGAQVRPTLMPAGRRRSRVSAL